MSFAASETAIPLVVDIDGAALRTNPIWEGLIRVAVRHPRRLPSVLGVLTRGRRTGLGGAAGEALGAAGADVPIEPAVLELIEEARAAGQPVVLVSAAQAWLLPPLARRLGAEWVAIEDAEALAGLRSRYRTFDFLGAPGSNSGLSESARRAYTLVPGGRAGERRGRGGTPDSDAAVGTDAEVLRLQSRSSAVPALVRSLRPYQWAKNTLLFLPAVAAHLPLSWEVVLGLAGGFASFSATASAVYLVNDLADLPSDRAHPTKRHRPLAAGDVSVPAALGLTALLAGAAVALALQLPPAFRVVLGVYAVLTTAYSLTLKKRPILDVITLASLYASRIVAGAAVVGVPLSRWFLAFSVFFFFSLALVKRVVELGRSSADEAGRLPGRGYRRVDIPVLVALGTTAVMASALVYCLYITGPEVGELYTRPDLLWAGLPIILYWQSRVWLLVGRDALEEDPVVFALRDRISRVLFLAFLVLVWIAS